MGKGKFIGCTVLGIVATIVYASWYSSSLGRSMPAYEYPLTFFFIAGIPYGYPILRDFVASIISGCFLHIVLFLALFALEVTIAGWFGWILYLKDGFDIITSRNSNETNSDVYTENSNPDEDYVPSIHFDYGDEDKKTNTSRPENDLTLQDALDSINSFKNE